MAYADEFFALKPCPCGTPNILDRLRYWCHQCNHWCDPNSREDYFVCLEHDASCPLGGQ